MKKNNNFIKKVLNKEKSLKATVLSLFISIMILLSIIFGIQLIYIDNNQSKKDISEKLKNLSLSLNPDYAIGKFQSKQTYYKI